ncbi:hypothetical protein B0T10DRAFT_559467 [Thelonectria olida]|uniref:YMC020W-like alpha/beta hydrolase domain-containing protein n=1 Tax=Thelonectria olida TaxID=1576542 RepID=A0A9P8W9W8_9HYPO|nr:hypothetical protein B0T10DRAFT_559467 [Thelonectria olida]
MSSQRRIVLTFYRQIKKAKSWYASWPAPPKAAASTSVAKEHILGGTVKSNKALDLSRFDSKKADDSASLHSTTSTIRGLPNIPEAKASETVANEDSQQTAPQKPDDEPPSSQDPEPPQEDNKPDAETASDPTTAPQPTPSAGWFGWLARAPVSETKPASTKNNTEMAQKLPPTTTEEPTKEPVEDPPKPLSSEAEQRRPATPPAQTGQEDDVMKDVSSQVAKGAPTASWFGLWRASANPSTTTDPTPVVQSDPAPDQEPEDATMTDAPPPPPSPPHKHEPAPQVGSTWAFWSRDSPKPKGSPTSPESGEIAVMGEVSEAHPKPMEESDVSQSPTKTPETASKPKEIKTGGRSTWRRTRRLRPTSVELDSSSLPSSGTSTPTSTAPQTQDIGQMAPKVDSSNKSITESEIATKLQNNLLLPAFSSTYRMKENPSILKQITQFLLHTQQPPANHVVRVKDPPKIQKAIAIGVHGLFPASYLRPMIGQPTGTSLRFATLCAESIRRWAEDHGCGDCEIEKVALEGEGKIKDRVENLWKLMLNWMEHIRSADLIVIACHSQGVPVSIMLLEKLIDLGIITHAKIGVCAMAGVSMGPFPDIKSSLLMGSAAELWDFANPESDNSKRFEASLKKVLDYGARITFIGSIDDQLVPMESAVYSPANHPYIYRAVFIDGRVHAPDFIAHLIGFALKLRNLGVSDHGLIRELSVSLAGSLYSGAGHSRLYFDDAIYDLAISHALETAPVQNPPPCEITSRQGPLASANPFVLPWIMRGLLEEDFVKTELSAEANELLRQFDDWKPTNKALKDVKYRLEAVRSKL